MDSEELTPLKISCTASDCESNLHCFKFHKNKMTLDQKGSCRACGARLIDWKRLHKRDILDVNYTFEALKYELIRHHNWHVDIDTRALKHAHKKGISGLLSGAENRIRQSVAPKRPFRDGYQTPYEGNIIYYAQHATASCCRKCMEYWHNIPTNRELNDAEINYFVRLIMLYIKERLPELDA